MGDKKAYNLKVLLAKLKARGLDLTEEMAMMFMEELEAFLVESAEETPNPYDDVLKLVVPQAFKKLKAEQIDKINGKDDIQ